MLRLDYLIFGYRIISFSADLNAEVATRLLKNNLSGEIREDGSILVAESSRKKYIKALEGMEYCESDLKGLCGMLFRNRWRVGALSAFLLTVLIFIITSGFVWDVRISGNESVAGVEIIENLSDYGVGIGARWSELDTAEAERRILESYDKISWININRRGTVAYVTVKERGSGAHIDVKKSPCNIVAEQDCVIEEITVWSGIAAVKPGDTVKKGDLLISGVIPEELGGGFVAAEGEVFGRLTERSEVFVPRNEEKRVYKEERIQKFGVKILNLDINIFKNYRNCDNEYVIIDDERRPIMPGGVPLPIIFKAEYRKEYDTVVQSYTDAELIKIASLRLASERVTAISDAELLSIKSGGELFEDGYYMYSDMLILTDVGNVRLLSAQ